MNLLTRRLLPWNLGLSRKFGVVRYERLLDSIGKLLEHVHVLPLSLPPHLSTNRAGQATSHSTAFSVRTTKSIEIHRRDGHAIIIFLQIFLPPSWSSIHLRVSSADSTAGRPGSGSRNESFSEVFHDVSPKLWFHSENAFNLREQKKETLAIFNLSRMLVIKML